MRDGEGFAYWVAGSLRLRSSFGDCWVGRSLGDVTWG